MDELAGKKCVPCMSWMPPMPENKAREMLEKVPGWELVETAKKLRKKYVFKDFSESMAFVNKVAEVCDQEGHHADMQVSYAEVTLTLFTHKIGGLHENDFILAAKINSLG